MAASIDPIHQFELKPLVSLGHIGNQEIAFTQSALYMFAAVGVIAFITIVATAGRSVVPGRMQALAEVFYEFIADTLHQANHRGSRKRGRSSLCSAGRPAHGGSVSGIDPVGSGQARLGCAGAAQIGRAHV